MDRPPQLQQDAFQLLSDEEFKALPFAERIIYLRRAVQQRNAINRQIDSTLYPYRADKSE